MAAVKPYSFNYTNETPPFELKVKYKEGIDKLPKEHEACVRVTPATLTTPTSSPLKVKVFPDDGSNGLEFLMGIVTTQFDSTLNVENVPGEELFKV